jgi:integrase
MPSGSIIEYRGKRGLVFRVKYADASGRQVMETVGAERDGFTRKDAEAELRERIVRVEQRDYRRPSALTFAEAAERWYNSERVSRAWKSGTASQYRHWADDLADYFKGPVAAIQQRQAVAYRDWALAESSYSSPASVNSRLTVLRMVLAWAKDNEFRPDVPKLKYAKVRQHKGVPLKPEQVRALLKAFDDEQARVAFLTFVTTGLRKSELCGLRWRDVDLIENRLRVEDSKTETGERSIALGKALAETLWQHMRASAFQGEDERVFCHPELGSAYRMEGKYGYAPALRRAFKAAGLDWPEGFRLCHDLRVTCGTNDAMAGMNPAKLQTKLGHRDFRVTQRYVNLAGVVFADEAEALEQRLLGSPESSELGVSNPLGERDVPRKSEDLG